MQVDAQNFHGFTTRPTKRRTTDSNTPPSSDNTSQFDNPPSNRVFVNAKYQVLPEIQVKGWTPHNPVRCI
jgi:hypothetical protein